MLSCSARLKSSGILLLYKLVYYYYYTYYYCYYYSSYWGAPVLRIRGALISFYGFILIFVHDSQSYIYIHLFVANACVVFTTCTKLIIKRRSNAFAEPFFIFSISFFINMVLHFPVLHFPALSYGPTYSSPAFSSPAIWSSIFWSSIFWSCIFRVTLYLTINSYSTIVYCSLFSRFNSFITIVLTEMT